MRRDLLPLDDSVEVFLADKINVVNVSTYSSVPEASGGQTSQVSAMDIERTSKYRLTHRVAEVVFNLSWTLLIGLVSTKTMLDVNDHNELLMNCLKLYV